MYYFILYALLFIVAINTLHLLKIGGSVVLAASPFFWVSIFFLLIHVVTPIWKASTSTFRYQDTYEDWTLIINAIIACVFYTILAFTKRQSIKFADMSYKSRTIYLKNESLVFITACLFAFIGVYSIQNITSSINTGSALDSFLKNRIGHGVGNGLMKSLPNFLISSTIIFQILYLFGSKFKKLSLILSLCLASYAIWYYNLISSRNSIFLIFILLTSLYFFYRPLKISFNKNLLKKSAVIFFILLSIAYVFLNITSARYKGDSSYFEKRAERVVFYMVDGAFGGDESVVWMIENEYELQFGLTYVAAITNFIPRSIWPNKLLGGGPILKNEIYPGSYVVGQAGNSSLTTGLITELFLNFSYVGVLLGTLIWIYIAHFLVKRALSARNILACSSWLVVSILWSTAFLYAEALGFLIRTVFIILPLFVTNIICRIK